MCTHATSTFRLFWLLFEKQNICHIFRFGFNNVSFSYFGLDRKNQESHTTSVSNGYEK